MIRETAPAKLNLVLQVGPPLPGGLHPICSLFASIDLSDELELEPLGQGDRDVVECPGVHGPNLAGAALNAFRERVPGLPPLRLVIEKRIPVAAGLGGGSADAAAALRGANRLAGEPLDAGGLRELAAGLGSDVPSQVEPAHALVQGTGEQLEPVELPPLAALLAPQGEGLASGAVYAELDRLREAGAQPPRALDPAGVRTLLGAAPDGLAAGLENDLQPAALSLRPELADVLASLSDAGAPAAAVSGSGPTCFALFADQQAAARAAKPVPGAIVTALRSAPA